MLHKVLLGRSSSTLYGPEWHILQLSQGMTKHDFVPELLILYRRSPESPAMHPMTRQAQAAGIASTQLSDRGKVQPTMMPRIARRLRDGDFALVHTHDYKTNLVVGAAAAVAGLPRVATVHLHTRTTRALRVYRVLDLAVLRGFTHIIAISDAVRHELLAAGLAPDNVVTIHHSIDVDALLDSVTANRTAWLERWGLDPRSPVVTTIGRLTSQKGHDVFLEAVRHVLDDCPGIQFILIGDGPDQEVLVRLAAQLGVQNHVFFAGYQTDIPTWLAASDVVVIASRAEGLPSILLEAMALARPVVATRVGGIPEVIADGQTGLLLPPEAAQDLARGIVRLLAQPAWARTLGKSAQLRVRQQFSLSTMTAQVVEVYRQVLRAD